ncbi:MAG: RagB/SusD family nutrient uptake outer membrane protein [Tannerella sp.]|nr:RagB/SusD family nutrient uptake outer membrane protein [Tannerella sp.]
MKAIYKIISGVACLVSSLLWTGCSDEFLVEKTNYGNLSPDIYNDYTGARMRVEDLYLKMLPSPRVALSYINPSTGKGDLLSQSTEEFSGLSNFVHPDVQISSSSNLTDWFHVAKSVNGSPWGLIRNCNDILEGVSGSTLEEDQKKDLLGQVYFFRAWQYYLLVKTYGGVPIVDHVQVTDVSQVEGAIVPRATTRECLDFICKDLETASSLLPENWGAADFGRITKGAALALAGRARLLYASPLFNRADNTDRWQEAYEANKNAIDALTAGGFGLAYLEAPGLNGAGWAKMFEDYNSKEAVFVTLFNKVHDDNAAFEIYRNNNWEQSVRPTNAHGGGGMSTTAMMVDLFPMADGKKPTEAGTYNYDQLKFFQNRDPRFYRTFAFPGIYWRFEASNDPTTLGVDFPYTGANYVLWNYSWYKDAAKQGDITQSGYGADGLGLSYKGTHVRKRCNDFDMTPEPICLYRWSLEGNRQGSFGESALPFMEIRYAEVLLNFAEAACGSNHPAEAIQILKDIRKRAGYTNETENYGLDAAALAADRGKLFGAILYERQIELAFEGKRFDDMRRWLLWDGGANFGQITGAPSSWNLSGFNGNTCTYLGVQPFNGKRRDNFELTTKVFADEAQGKDPVKDIRPAALDLKKELSSQFGALANFYDANLIRKTRRGDEDGKVVTFQPKYYFIGFTSGAQTNNITLLQTIGWEDVVNGNINGTYDPLAE